MPSVLWLCWLGGRNGIRPVKKLSGGELVWLFVWREVQICIWPSWCHWHLLSFASVKSRLVLPFWLTWVVSEKGRSSLESFAAHVEITKYTNQPSCTTRSLVTRVRVRIHVLQPLVKPAARCKHRVSVTTWLAAAKLGRLVLGQIVRFKHSNWTSVQLSLAHVLWTNNEQSTDLQTTLS